MTGWLAERFVAAPLAMTRPYWVQFRVASVKTNIAGRIRQAREQARLEPAELRAELRSSGIELSKTGLHRLENIEPTNPNLKLIEAIAEITGVSPGWLLFGKGPSIPADQMGTAIRGRIIDTIEHMAGALDLTAKQTQTLNSWISSVRGAKPKKSRRR